MPGLCTLYRPDGKATLLQWIIFAVLFIIAIAFLACGITVLVLHGLHRTPAFLSVNSAGLEQLRYDPQLGGLRDLRLRLGLLAETGDRPGPVSFSKVAVNITYGSTVIFHLSTDSFDLPIKTSRSLQFPAHAVDVVLKDPRRMQEALKTGLVVFGLSAEAMTQWQEEEGAVEAMAWTSLTCTLSFHWPLGSPADISCSSAALL